MVNAPEEWGVEEYKDIDSTNYYHMVREMTNGDPSKLKEALLAMQHLARDHSRLPMQWSAEPNAGFSAASAKPWMRAHDNHTEVNVQAQEGNSSSVLAFWKTMMRLRKEYADVLVFGTFELLDEQNGQVFSYIKKSAERSVLVTLNFSDTPQKIAQGRDLKLLVSSAGESTDLQAWEGRIYELAH